MVETVGPRGKQAVVAAILVAGRRLFAAHPYSAVSIRRIAEAAGVNPGLIHRHIGSKRDVLKQVFAGYARHFAAVNAAAASPLQGLIQGFGDDHVRDFLYTTAFAILSGEPVDDLVSEDGGTMVMLRRGRAGPGQHDGPDLVAALALLMGWTLFSPFLLKSSGGLYDRRLLEERIYRIVERLSGPSTPAE